MALGVALAELNGSYESVGITATLRRGEGRLLFSQGLPEASLSAARAAINACVRLSSYIHFSPSRLGESDLIISHTPKYPLVGASFTLALAAAVLAEVSRKQLPNIAFTGVVGEDGVVYPVEDIDRKLDACGRLGYNALVLPSSQLDFMCTKVNQITVTDLFQLYANVIDQE